MNIEKWYVLIAEGVTDCSLLEAVLEKYLSYKQFQNMDELPQLLRDMIGKYPSGSGELKRQDSPVFYYKDNIAVAVKMAGGCSKLANTAGNLIEVVNKLDEYKIFGGFLLFCDTDTEDAKSIRQKLIKEFEKAEFIYEGDVIKAYDQDITCKLHLFPTVGCGAVEKLLLECAAISYKDLTDEAFEYRKHILDTKYDKLRGECWAKNTNIQDFYADKVQFGAISTVLRPDKPVRFSIKDKLIRKQYKDQYMNIPEFKMLYEFLLENLK